MRSRDMVHRRWEVRSKLGPSITQQPGSSSVTRWIAGWRGNESAPLFDLPTLYSAFLIFEDRKTIRGFQTYIEEVQQIGALIMKNTNCKASDDPHVTGTESKERALAIAAATAIFQRLLITASDTVGFPSKDTSRPTIDQGVLLVEEFLEISNPHVRGLVVQLVSAIAELTK